MTAREVLRLLDLLEGDGIDVWLDGGWGVDALLGHETREHDDLDLVCKLVDSDRIAIALERAGYEVAAGGAPLSFVLVDPDGRQVDVHPVTFHEARGGGVYLMEGGSEWVYPSAGFEGHGTVARRGARRNAYLSLSRARAHTRGPIGYPDPSRSITTGPGRGGVPVAP